MVLASRLPSLSRGPRQREAKIWRHTICISERSHLFAMHTNLAQAAKLMQMSDKCCPLAYIASARKQVPTSFALSLLTLAATLSSRRAKLALSKFPEVVLRKFSVEVHAVVYTVSPLEQVTEFLTKAARTMRK